jgi:hypothetical protein
MNALHLHKPLLGSQCTPDFLISKACFEVRLANATATTTSAEGER